MGQAADSLKAANDSLAGAIQKEWRDKDKKTADEKPRLRFDWSRVVKPTSPEVFKAPFHFPPHRQYRTGTCWCFSTTSFFESEMQRLHGKSVKLSEMYAVYWEYVEKARGYIAKRGCQPFAPGSEADAVAILWKQYGVVPATAYTGLATRRRQVRRRAAVRRDCQLPGVGEEPRLLGRDHPPQPDPRHPRPHHGTAARRVRLRRAPRYTPQRFLAEVVRLRLDDYVQFMSTLVAAVLHAGQVRCCRQLAADRRTTTTCRWTTSTPA